LCLMGLLLILFLWNLNLCFNMFYFHDLCCLKMMFILIFLYYFYQHYYQFVRKNYCFKFDLLLLNFNFINLQIVLIVLIVCLLNLFLINFFFIYLFHFYFFHFQLSLDCIYLKLKFNRIFYFHDYYIRVKMCLNYFNLTRLIKIKIMIIQTSNLVLV
jgi:hypothetical protein